MADPFDKSSSPVTEPTSILAGSYISWRRELDYDSALFDLKYRIILLGVGTTYEIAGSQSGDYWEFEALSAVTALWTSGEYRYDLQVIRKIDPETSVIYTGRIDVFASTDERRTHAEIMITKIESLLSGRADHDIESYSIKSRSLTKMSTRELNDWRDYYLAEVGRTGGSTTDSNVPCRNTVRVRWVN